MPPTFEMRLRQVIQQVTQVLARVSEEIIEEMLKVAKARETQTDDAQEKARVTDRRKVRFDSETTDDGSDKSNEQGNERESADYGSDLTNEAAGDARTDGAKSRATANVKSPEIVALETRAHAAETKLIEVQQRFNELRAQIERDAQEMRSRLQRSTEERLINEKAEFVAALLPVMDNFRRAIEATEKGTTPENLLDGLRGTASGFETALARIGVEAVKSIGEQFNPELHEAVDTVEADEDGIITAEYARGYRVGNRLLRAAKVQVGKKQ